VSPHLLDADVGDLDVQQCGSDQAPFSQAFANCHTVRLAEQQGT
jgi:hypothetical protein